MAEDFDDDIDRETDTDLDDVQVAVERLGCTIDRGFSEQRNALDRIHEEIRGVRSDLNHIGCGLVVIVVILLALGAARLFRWP